MEMNEKNALYDACTAKWGVTAQAQMAVEECGELIQATSKVFFRGRVEEKHLQNLVSELADVRIMIEQLTRIYGFESAVEAEMDSKLCRLALRVGNQERELM